MGNIQSNSDLTRLVQDVQYTAALKGMSDDQKAAYFSSQKDSLIDNLTNDRQSTFQKTYTDAVRNNAIQNSLLYYHVRNRDVDDIGEQLNKSNQDVIGIAKGNKDLATRQREINEWTYGNKLDTLFVFQILFITVLLSSGFVYLQKIGLFSSSLLGILIGILLFIDIIIIINRVNYTNRVRDQRYWNRRQFGHFNVDTGSGPSDCPPSYSSFKDSFKDYSPAPVSTPGLIKV
jgi:hypothetical protein